MLPSRRQEAALPSLHLDFIASRRAGSVAERGLRRMACAIMLVGMLALSVQAVPVGLAHAQDGWNPFQEAPLPGTGARRPGRPTADAVRPELPSSDAAGPPARPSGLTDDGPAGAFVPRDAVERSDLPPLSPVEGEAAQESVAVPAVTSAAAQELSRFARELELPTRSPALAKLLVRVLGPGGSVGDASLEAIGARGLALYRAGRVQDAAGVAGQMRGAGRVEAGPLRAAMTAFQARLALASGERDKACTAAQELIGASAGAPKGLVAEAIAINGYCGAVAGNASAAGLAASLLREQGGAPERILLALEGIAAGAPVRFAPGARVDALEWRLAEAAGKLDAGAVQIDRLEPAALVAAAQSAAIPARLRLAAAEAAARINASSAQLLAEAYRGQTFSKPDLAQALTARVEPWARRALLFMATEDERTPFKRTRLVRAALDDARRAGLFWPMAAALARVVEDIRPVAEVGWFAETAVEVMAAAGRYDEARRWAQFGSEAGTSGDRPSASLAHWLALIDIAEPAQRGARGQSLASVEELALRGRFTAEGLHRLATVLDALDYHVPVRLWEAASRAPQPSTGHLPATGVLPDLQDAARRKDLVRTLALVFRTLGPDGPEGAHMIALGDTIRALRRAGLDADARQTGFEALFGLWPRSPGS